MKLHRVWAMVLRYFYFFIRSYDRLSDVFYWPLMDILLWGLTISYLRNFGTYDVNILTVFMAGLLFWIIVWRGQYEITVNLLQELWDKNLVNMFVSPLTFMEWVASFMVVGVAKALISFTFALTVVYLLYKVQIFFYGFYLLPFMVSLIMTGWAFGFGVAGLLLRYGTKVQTFAWSMVYVFAPFSAIYYPVSVLPHWAQIISGFLPTSYMFEGIRQVIFTGTVDTKKIYMSFALNAVYLLLTFLFMRSSFKKTLEKGLVKVY